MLFPRRQAEATDTAADAADSEIIRDMCLRSGAGFSDVLVVDHDAKFTSEVFRAFVTSMGSSLIVGSAYHKNTNAKAPGGTGPRRYQRHAAIVCQRPQGPEDDWDKQLTFSSRSTTQRRRSAGTRHCQSPGRQTRRRAGGERIPARPCRHRTPITPHMSRRANMRSGCAPSKRWCESCWRRRRRPAREARRGPDRYGVPGGRPRATPDQGAARRGRYR